MSHIETYAMPHSTVFSIYSEMEDIQVDPDYQRHGGIWTKEKKQLLIDSIINRYDIPKLYFHKLGRKEIDSSKKRYAIIDGRQRLETIWEFIDGRFALSEDFLYLNDPLVKIRGMTYSDLGVQYPKIKNRFDSTDLPIVIVDTDDKELIEDMFSRLNEAVPLNAAEQRNAYGGNVIRAVNAIVRSTFFKRKAKFLNRRYQHREVAIRLLYITYCQDELGKIIDTKKVYLDRFAKDFHSKRSEDVDKWKAAVLEVLSKMNKIFSDKDGLLQAQASVPVYFLVIKNLSDDGNLDRVSRAKLLKFNDERASNRIRAAEDIVAANFEFLEYDRMSQQGTNDASSIRERVQILTGYLGAS